MAKTYRGAIALLLTMFMASANVAHAAGNMFRDPSCGCCEKWAEHVRTAMKMPVEVTESMDMATVKDREQVPADLRSCHTMIVNGYVIEGHVPAADIERLLKNRPEGVTGLAVPGMPIGSRGMEMGSERDPYEVIAFGPDGRRVFARYH